MPAADSTDDSLSVSQFNQLVRDVLAMGFPQALWVCGEVQGYDRNRDRNHVFFELCEKDAGSQQVLARIGLVIFSGRKAHIRQQLQAAADNFQLKDDIEVRFLCRVDFYPPHGAVRLIVESIDPVYTLGKIAQQKQQLIKKLKDAGLLDLNKSLPLPDVPLRIGLVTAYDSAAYNDFLSELKLSGYGFRVEVCDAKMQGKQTEPEVCRALRRLNAREDLDVIVVTRGGGSIADLSAFDSEKIATAVAKSRLPVLSGIGHEIDLSVTDLAAHTYQKTPTAVARFLVERVDLFLDALDTAGGRLTRTAQAWLDNEKRRMHRSALDLQAFTQTFFKRHWQDLSGREEVLRRAPQALLRHRAEDLSRLREQCPDAARRYLRDVRQRLAHYDQIVRLADPQRVLRRGFSLTYGKNGKAVRSVEDVNSGDLVTTRVGDGSFTSRVREDGRAAGQDLFQ